MNYIKRIIEYFSKRTFSENINREVHERLLDHEGDLEQEEALRAMWDNIGFPKAETFSEKAYERLYHSIHPQKKFHFLYRWMRIAAVWLIPFFMLISSLYFYKESNQLEEITYKEKYVPFGKREQFTLPDGSEVWLNSATLLVYPSKFIGNNREVYLVGEGFFKVKKNVQRPFIVRTNEIKLQVLGTEFNVSSYPDQNKFTAALESGSIKIIPTDTTIASCILEPNDYFTYFKSTGITSVEHVKATDYSDWREGGLLFHDKSLEEIFKSLERVYNVKVYLRSSAYTSNRLTIHFNKHESLENILMLIKELVPSMNYVIEENKVVLY